MPSTDPAARQGSLLVNFGGPVGSGTASIEAWAAGLDPRVRAAYDIVGFDPRGVGSSTAVECLDDAAMDASRATTVDPDTPEGLAQAVAAAERFAAACAANTGPLLGEVDTTYGVRLLGVGVSGLADWIQEDLFAEEPLAEDEREDEQPGDAVTAEDLDRLT